MNSEKEIYLDNSATTGVFPEVAELMKEVFLEDYGNPSSLHRKGIRAEKRIRDAKEILSGILGCAEKNLLFTSGGTESDNLAILGTAAARNRAGRHLITTRIEHPAVLQSMKALEEQGFRVTYLPVDAYGTVSLSALREALTEDTILVSVMHTNNEIGTVQPLEKISALIREKCPEAYFHVDAVQGFGKFSVKPKKTGIDLLSVSGHKLHGPKGIGLLYCSDRVRLKPICFGGGQQGGLRSGTENVPGIAGLAEASRILYEHLEEDTGRLFDLRSFFIRELQGMENCHVNGVTDPGQGAFAPHIVSAAFPGIRSEVLLHTLEDRGIYVSAGSACSSHKAKHSATLEAVGAPGEILESSIRFSFSVHTTREELEETLRVLREQVPILRRFTAR